MIHDNDNDSVSSNLLLENNDDVALLCAKSRIFMEKTIAIHIEKKDGFWLNGIISEVSTEFLIIEEFKKGKMPVFFIEMKKLEPYTIIQKGKKR